MTSALPRVSILVPCRNEERNIVALLDALRAQTYPAEQMEIIVADGRSTDASREKIAAYAAAHPIPPVTLVDNPGVIPPAGLNAALRAARGEVILRMDGHALPAADYVERCARTLEETGSDGVGGIWEIVPGGPGTMARAIAAAGASPFGAGGAQYRQGGEAGEADTVPFGAYRRAVFERIGSFNETLRANEDYEFNYRLRRVGGKLYFSPAIRSRYIARPNVAALARQYWIYGLYKTAMLSRYPRSLRLRQLLPALFSLWIIAGIPCAFIGEAAIIPWAAGLFVYFLADLLASLREGVLRRDGGIISCLTVVFPVEHLAWGCGFWAGWVRLALRPGPRGESLVAGKPGSVQ